jgi:hypothetical protein
MFPGIGNARIFLYRLPTDMRRSYDTLAAMAENELGEEPLLSIAIFCLFIILCSLMITLTERVRHFVS